MWALERDSASSRTLIGGGFLVYAVLAVVRGTLYDVDDGRVDRSARPVTFWLLVGGMTLLGLSILGVGWGWLRTIGFRRPFATD